MATYKMTKTEIYYIEAGSDTEARNLLNELDNGSASRVDVDAELVSE